MPCNYKKYNFSGIYYIINTNTGKYYIGSSLNITKRFYQYDYLLSNNKCHSPKLQNSYNKHGKEVFEYGLVEKCLPNELKEREHYWINNYDSVNTGYNCSNNTICSTRGMKHTVEARNKMSKIQKILNSTDERKKLASDKLIKYNKSQKGIGKSHIHKLKIGLSNKGKIRSQEFKDNMKGREISDSTKEKMRQFKLKNPVRYWLGKNLSDEAKRKIALSRIGKRGILSNCYKPISQYNKNGTLINSFYGAADAGRELGISRTAIKNCLNGYSKSAGGFVFKYNIILCQ